MELLKSIFSGATGGGLIGLLGSCFSVWTEHKKQVAAYKHQEQMEKLKQDTIRLEVERDIETATIHKETAISIAESEAIEASHKSDTATYSKSHSPWFVFVDVMRGLIRPTVTIYAILILTYIAIQLEAIPEDINKAFELYSFVVESVVFVCVTVVLWWFGTRVKKPEIS